MADSRDLTFGLYFGLEPEINKLSEAEKVINGIKDAMQGLESSSQDTGEQAGKIGASIKLGAESADGLADALQASEQQARKTADAAADSFNDTARSAAGAGDEVTKLGSQLPELGSQAGKLSDDTEEAFRKIGAQADSIGSAITKSMGAAYQGGASAAQGIRAGFDGAFGFVNKKADAFFSKFSKGAKSIGTALRHPIQTIKNKFIDSLKAASQEERELGRQSDETEKDLNDMGAAGSDAGGAIKDGIKSAIGAFIGIEAIKKGVELVKQFVGAALEAAGAAENATAKFDNLFAGTDAEVWVDNFSSAVHRSTAEVKDFMVQNKAMYSELGITGEAANDLSKMTTSLAYDFGNFFRMSDDEALSVLQDAIGGNTNALNEYGITLDEATLKASAMEMGLGKDVSALDDAVQAQVRLNAILKQSSKIQQAAANDTDGLVNKTKSLKGIWSDFMADAGAKFTPVLDSLFGAIMDAWPRVEPMLLGLVDVLSNGLAQASPVLIQLGETLIPVLTDVIGSLFTAAMPLLSIFGELAETILPPVANVIGMIADTILPPFVSLLDTLNTAVIQPLMPVLQRIAEAILPPIAKVMEALQPVLEAVSPVLGVIGDVLGTIADVLGTVIGWLADGIGKIGSFFGNLFGGAKDSAGEVRGLNSEIGKLNEATGIQPELGVDVTGYRSAIDEAAESTTDAVTESTTAAKEITDVNFIAMGTSAEMAYSQMAIDAETAWGRMETAAANGARNISASFDTIGSAAAKASGSTVSVGVDIPHNARGTDYFPGGLTHINEEGGEIVGLPNGSTIIPADKSQRLVNAMSSSQTTTTSHNLSLSVPITVTVQGNADAQAGQEIALQIKAVVKQLMDEYNDENAVTKALQAGFVLA